jgi:Glycosyl hydrolases family 18
MKKLFPIFGFLLCTASASAQAQWSMVYYAPASMSFYNSANAPLPLSAIQWSAVTHVMLVGGNPNSNGSITLESGFSTYAPLMITAAHAHGVKVLYALTNLSIGGTGWAGAASPGNLSTFIANIMSTVSTYGFDGVEIDWEEAFNQTEETNLFSGLRTALGTNILTASVTNAPSCGTPSQSWTAIIPYLDRWNILSYDGNGPWNPETWFSSPLYSPSSPSLFSVDVDVKASRACGYPMAKVGIGLPFYGYLTSPSNGPYQSFGASPSLTQLGTENIRVTYGSTGYTYDTTAHVPWKSLSGSSWIATENVQSITDKVNYTKVNNLGGWVIYIIGGDYNASQSPTMPLLNAVNSAMGGGGGGSDLYISQSSAGGNTGADCADARAVASLVTGDWVPGHTIHLCGTISTQLSVLASGTSGSVITVKWEPGAKLSQAAGSLISLNSHNYLLFDGGTDCGPVTSCASTLSGTGIIENTANGSGLAHQSVNVYAFSGTSNTANIEVKNLLIQNLYVHSSLSDATSSSDVETGLFYGYPLGTGWSVHDNTLKDMGTCFQLQGFTPGATISIYKNYCYNMDWGVGLAGSGTRTVLIHDNHFGSTTNWDTTIDAFHHDGLHFYMPTSATSIATEVYNNTFDGNWGSCCSTAFVYQEFSIPNQFDMFNNVFNQTASSGAWPMVVASSQNGEWDNNTFMCGAGSNTKGSSQTIVGLSGTLNFRNNVFKGCTTFLGLYTGGAPATVSGVTDYAVYMAPSSGGNSPWTDGSGTYSTLAAFRSACGCDSHSANFTANTLNANGSPTSSFPGIAAGSNPGVNLTSIATGNLAALASGATNGGQQSAIARPSGGSWDVGAFVYGSGVVGNAIPSTFFGMHVNQYSHYPLQIPYGQFRSWDAGTSQWPDVETCQAASGAPTDPCFTWIGLDTQQADLKTAGIDDVFYTLSRTPAWGSSNSTDVNCNYYAGSAAHRGACYPPTDLNSDGTGTNQIWKNWVTALATHVNNSAWLTTHAHIKYWEIWNEFYRSTTIESFAASPGSLSWQGTYNQLVRLAEDARCIITGTGTIHNTPTFGSSTACSATAIDSSAKIVAPSGTTTAGSRDAVQNFLYCNHSPIATCTTGTAGALTVDIINAHLYPTNITPEFVASTSIPSLQAVLQSAELAKPLWNGEGSWGTLPNVSNIWNGDAYARAGFIPRFFALNWSAGVTENFWYSYDIVTGQLFTTSLVTPESTAWATTYNWLVNAVPTQTLFCATSGTVYACAFQEGSGKLAEIVWDSQYGPGGITSPANCTTSGTPTICGTTSYSVPVIYNGDWIDILGGVHAIGGTVTIGAVPILLESAAGGGGGGPVASFSPASVTFPNTVVSVPSSAITVTLTNTGGATMTGISISITGASAGDFSQTNTCSATLTLGSSCTISVTFTPSVAASRSASVSVAFSAFGSPGIVPLSGSGLSSSPSVGFQTKPGIIFIE